MSNIIYILLTCMLYVDSSVLNNFTRLDDEVITNFIRTHIIIKLVFCVLITI